MYVRRNLLLVWVTDKKMTTCLSQGKHLSSPLSPFLSFLSSADFRKQCYAMVTDLACAIIFNLKICIIIEILKLHWSGYRFNILSNWSPLSSSKFKQQKKPGGGKHALGWPKLKWRVREWRLWKERERKNGKQKKRSWSNLSHFLHSWVPLSSHCCDSSLFTCLSCALNQAMAGPSRNHWRENSRFLFLFNSTSVTLNYYFSVTFVSCHEVTQFNLSGFSLLFLKNEKKYLVEWSIFRKVEHKYRQSEALLSSQPISMSMGPLPHFYVKWVWSAPSLIPKSAFLPSS